MADSREVFETNGVTKGVHSSHIGVDYAQEGKDMSALTVKLDVDASDAIKALKAVQREAREATQALRELERTSRRREAVDINDLRDVQGQDGNWNSSEYMCGLFNGLELASATLEGRAPEYREFEPVISDIQRSYE